MNYKVGNIVKFERTTTRDDWKIYLIKDNLYYIRSRHTYTAVPKYHLDWYNGGIGRG